MMGRLFDESGWPTDSRLDPFRDALWELRLAGQPVAHLTTQVSPMRSFPALWRKQEWLWFQVNWFDGRRDRSDEDYGPEWYSVAELERGRFVYHDGGRDITFAASPITGEARDILWSRYGPP